MKFKLNTSIMQEMVTKVIKGATNNKMIPLTGLLAIRLNNGVLDMTTTDAVNFFSVKTDKVEGESFEIVTKVDLFSKLVSKTTSEFITLELDNNTLSFTGNGTYKIDLPLNEEGNLIKFPYPAEEINGTSGVIKLSVIKSIILANKPALAVSMEAPHLTGYMCTPDSVVSADSFNICVNKSKTFSQNTLIAPIVFDLLAMSDSEDISYVFTDKLIKFYTDKLTLWAKPMTNANDYPLNAVKGFTDGEFPSFCVLPKTLMLNVLDRLSLFISDFDVNGVYLTFTQEGVHISSTNKTANELIPYQDSKNFQPFTCLAGVDSLKKQIQARTGEVVQLHYGIRDAVKLVDNNIIQIVALLENDMTEEV